MGSDGCVEGQCTQTNAKFKSFVDMDWRTYEVEGVVNSGNFENHREKNDGWVYYHDYRRCKSIYHKTGKKTMSITQMMDYLIKNKIVNISFGPDFKR